MVMMPRLLPSMYPVGDRKPGRAIRLYIWNSGWASTCGGSRFPAVNSSSSTMLKRHEKRLMPKATRLERVSVITTEGITMSAVTK